MAIKNEFPDNDMMMKITLLIAVFTLTVSTINAKINVGIEVIPTLSDKPSWSAGVNLEIPINEKLFLSPGIYYASLHRYNKSLWETFEYHPEGDIPIHYEKASVNVYGDYIQIPFIIGSNCYKSPNYDIKIGGGLYYAYCLGGKSKLKMDDNGDATFETISSYPDFIGKRSDVGLCVEAKFLFNKHYQIGLNLQHGLIKIYEGYNVPGINDIASLHRLGPGVQFHQSIGLSIGYVF